jgi:hypothetical protein
MTFRSYREASGEYWERRAKGFVGARNPPPRAVTRRGALSWCIRAQGQSVEGIGRPIELCKLCSRREEAKKFD